MFSCDFSKICHLMILVSGLLLFPNSVSIAQTNADPSSLATQSQHISLQPYRIRIDIAYAPKSRLTPLDHNHIQQRLIQIIDRSIGEKWILADSKIKKSSPLNSLGIYENNWLPLASGKGLQRLKSEDILKRYPNHPFDKLFLITIEQDGIGYLISGREFDSYSRNLSPLSTKKTFAKPFLSETIFESLRDLFSAVVTIESVNGNQAIVSEQASQYPPPDPSMGTLQKNFYFIPFFRYLNRDREVKNIQFIPWTYLVLEEINRKYATCLISSGLRGVLSGSRRRVETFAIRVKQKYPETKLSLIPRGTSFQTAAGIKVQTSPLDPQQVRQRQREAKKQKELKKTPQPESQNYITGEFLTNRSGTITLKADSHHPLIWLYVRSGKALVANVPYIPGINREINIQIPDDRIRLSVEGELAVLNGELIEAVASLSMKMSRIRKWAKNKDWKKVDAGIGELESGISPKQIFDDKLNVIQVSAVEAAQAQKNRSAQSRIASLCRETSGRIERFLDPTGIIDLKTEINDLKQLQRRDPNRRKPR
ncbi:MAG: hypothetical protein K0U86_08020 [Planctomycetes bacterium]|nr:hypothetical protein [Planctomycetota bacterium]MCH9724835.1 hypothetical protein [Planctomycetota bacterium]MCH9778775.1 hypothetical protein [Planctomycetota bacterium]MCH9792052.1 hypothetical protein [Planctomycetota bacterium]